MPYIHETTPEQEAEIARQALAANDFGQAAYHIGTALQFDPTRADWRAFLDQVLRSVPDPLQILRLGDKKADLVTAVTRAYALATKDRTDEALALLCGAVSARPELPFLVWGAEWARRPGVIARLPLDVAAGQIVRPLLLMVQHVPSPVDANDPRYKNVYAAAEIMNALREVHAQDAFVLFGCSVVARRVAQWEWAIHFAGQAYQLQPDWNSTIGVACAYRDAGKVDDAVQWFRHAHGLQPDDPAALLDIGDLLLKAGRWDEAIGVYQEVLGTRPGHPWATPSIVYARFKKTGDVQEKSTLLKLADRWGRAWALFCELEPPQPYVNQLPPPADATANGLRDVIGFVTQSPEKAEGGNVKFAVTHPESPSVLTAFQVFVASRKVNMRLELAVEKVQTPDPRVPKAQVEFALWAYDGTTPRPALGTPDPRAAEMIAGIAREPYHLGAWDAAARQVAAQMGTPWLQHVAATMVNPPALPRPDMDPLAWVQRVQIAAALVIGRMESTWEGSARKRALSALALGPVDWSVDAALVVLAWLAKDDPAIRADAAGLYAWLEGQIPADGYTCFEYPLVCAWLSLEGVDAATTARLTKWKAQIEQRGRAAAADAAEAGKPPVAERHGGLTLEQYAELSVKRDAIVAKHGGGIGKGLMAMAGQGSYKELEALCKEYGLDPKEAAGGRASAAAGRIAGWDTRINEDRRVQEMFFALQNDVRLKMQGIDFNSHEGRVAEQIRAGNFSVEDAKVGAQVAAQKIAAGDGGDPDPVVFPGQKLAKLSDYVGLMKGMQTGDMMGALQKVGLDMGSYATVAQAWGIKLASDPVLTAKFGAMMAAK